MPLTPDADVLLPIEYSDAAQGGPQFATVITYFPDGHEQRVISAWDPAWRWQIQYGLRTRDEMAGLQSFFNDRRGRAQTFLFVRPGDVAAPSSDSSPYIQASDPGSVGAGRWWIDTSGSLPYPFKVRNTGNSAWTSLGSVVRRARFDQDLFRAKYDVSADSGQLQIIELSTPEGSLPGSFASRVTDELPGEYQSEAMAGADWQTTILRSPSGVEARRDERSGERRRFLVLFDVMSGAALGDFVQFFISRRGRAQAFKFTPPEGGGLVDVRFGQDDLTYSVGLKNRAIGSVELVEVL